MSWPTHSEPVSRSAAAWLLAGFLLLAGWDAWVYKTRPRLLERLEPLSRSLEVPRFVGPVVVIVLLLLTRRVKPREMGFTLGNPKATLVWCFGPLVIGCALFAAVALALAVVFHFAGWRLPGAWLQRTALGSVAQWQREWPWQLWWWCGQAPLLEEPVYRAMPYAALLPFVGKRGAILGVAVIWTWLHWWYGWSAWHIPYYFFFWGLFVTCIYSQTQSLVTTVLLHGLLNFIGPLLVDLTILTQRDWLRLWFNVPA